MPKPPSRQPGMLPPSGASPVSEAPAPADVARYIAEMAAELSSMARHSRLELLAYLLDMARLEAGNIDRHAKAHEPQR